MTGADEAELLAAAIEGIAKIVEAVRNAKSGAIDPATALSKIQSVHDALAANNAKADAEEAAKFKP